MSSSIRLRNGVIPTNSFVHWFYRPRGPKRSATRLPLAAKFKRAWGRDRATARSLLALPDRLDLRSTDFAIASDQGYPQRHCRGAYDPVWQIWYIVPADQF